MRWGRRKAPRWSHNQGKPCVTTKGTPVLIQDPTQPESASRANAPVTIHEAFDDDEQNTGPLPILGRDLHRWPTRRVLSEVAQEREAQDTKWGPQNHHPDGTHVRWSDTRDNARRFCDDQHKAGTGTWLDILLEEVYEAAAEPDVTRLRAELIQISAVAAAWVEAIDRRSA